MASSAAETYSFDVEWARAVIDQAVRRLEENCRRNERKDLWGVFQDAFLVPTLEGNDPPSMAQLAKTYGFVDASQASNRLVTAKRMFRRMLETLVSEYLDEGQAFEDEIRDLINILGGGS